MKYDLTNLIKYANENDGEICKKICGAVIKFSNDSNAVELSSEVLNQSIDINLDEITSLFTPDKYDFQTVDIGDVNIEKAD